MKVPPIGSPWQRRYPARPPRPSMFRGMPSAPDHPRRRTDTAAPARVVICPPRASRTIICIDASTYLRRSACSEGLHTVVWKVDAEIGRDLIYGARAKIVERRPPWGDRGPSY